MRYEWILFDADGVLFDYDRAEREALTASWADAGLEPRDELIPTYRRLNQGLWLEFEQGQLSQDQLRWIRFERLLEAMGQEGDAPSLSEAYIDGLKGCGHLLDGAMELLGELRGRAGMALVTNGIAEVQRSRLARSGIEEFFETIIISAEVGAAKPDPRIFDAAFAGLGNPPREKTVMIGDSLSSDMRGGVDYGIATVWLRPAGQEGGEGLDITHQAADLAEVRRILLG